MGHFGPGKLGIPVCPLNAFNNLSGIEHVENMKEQLEQRKTALRAQKKELEEKKNQLKADPKQFLEQRKREVQEKMKKTSN